MPEADLLWKQILARDPERRPVPAYDKNYYRENRGTLLPGSGGYSYLRRDIEKPLTVLMIIVGMVLLIACANVANLLLARAAARQKEIAIRLAIGAGRARLVVQLLVETLAVSCLGGLLGLAFAWWGARLLLTFLPQRGVPLVVDVTPDWRLLVFSCAVSVAAGLVCGLIPALQGTRPTLTSALKNESSAIGRVRFDVRKLLVVSQVAMSLLLLIGAGLFVRSLSNLRSLDPGFVRDSVLIVHSDAQSGGYKGQRLRNFYERVLARIRMMPHVKSASLAEITPLEGSRWNGGVMVEGYQRKPDEKPYVDFNGVSDGYFASLGIPILQGRDFRPQDNPAVTPDPKPGPPKDEENLGPPPPVAIVNEAFARHFFPHTSAMGKHFTQGDKPNAAKTFEIVGVVKNSTYFSVREAVEPMIYVPIWRFGSSSSSVCIRSDSPPKELTAAVRQAFAALDPAIPVLQTGTLEDQFDNTIAQERVVTMLCSFFGMLALLLASIGLYGVMAHMVTRRFREIGIRMALGARSRSVLWLVLRDTALMVGAGAAIGVPAALTLTRFVTAYLYGLTPQDPISILVATAGLVVVTALAGYIPARRATRVDPMIALRYE